MVIPLKDLVVEHKLWMTKAGFPAVIRFNDGTGVYCAYVGVPKGHALYGVTYGERSKFIKKPADDEPVGKRGILPLFIAAMSDDEDKLYSLDCIFDVHGGITYSRDGISKKGRPSFPDNDQMPGYWWFGFDCGHAGDGRHHAWLAKKRQEHPQIAHCFWESPEDPFRDLFYVKEECESLAIQLIDRVRTMYPHEWVIHQVKRAWSWYQSRK